MDETHGEDDSSPDNDEERQPESGTDFADDEVGWQLKDGITDEKDEECDGVSGADVEAQVFLQAGDVGRGDVGSVEEGECKDEAQHGEDVEVDSANKLLLLLRSPVVQRRIQSHISRRLLDILLRSITIRRRITLRILSVKSPLLLLRRSGTHG